VYTQLDAPGATSSNAYAISGNGQVTGVGKDHIGSHGFVWDPVKGFKVFNVPGSAAGSTYPSVINGSGVIAGSYYDRRPILLGFVRLRSGKIEAIEGNDSSARMVPTAINASGQVTGYEFDQGSTSGFVRDADGTITLFGTESHGGPTPTAINNDGTIVGYFFSDGSPNQAFVRDSAGNITFPQLPHTDLGNIAVGIDAQGKIIGYYNDASEVNHGWLFIP
jgi:uncharacterized membrane protein